MVGVIRIFIRRICQTISIYVWSSFGDGYTFYLAKIGTAIIFLEAIFEALDFSTDEENANMLNIQIFI